MVSEIRIYVEGGGDRSDSKAAIREGFNNFLQPLRDLARAHRARWSLTVCGSRNAAFDAFRRAIEDYPDSFLVLLVDAESLVTHSPWKHLRDRDGWDSGELAVEHCHLMVQTVEAWLVADPETLADFYGKGFLQGALPRRHDVEAIAKDDLVRALDRATARTQKGRYHKILHCSILLGLLNRDRVRARARHCDLLFTTLEARIRGTAE
ncbi:MAG TPA: DUF4276 family protein [Thermoanaerobaculia bacterium]|jgi:hypothetical protein|nr:DUF4276 family protein [Thermoanaerobaculia bacterium]